MGSGAFSLVRVMFTIAVFGILSFPVNSQEVDQSCEEYMAFYPSKYGIPKEYTAKFGTASSILLKRLRVHTIEKGSRDVEAYAGVVYKIYWHYRVMYDAEFSFIGRAYCLIADEEDCQKCLDEAHAFFNQCKIDDGKIYPGGHSYLPNCGMSFFFERFPPPLSLLPTATIRQDDLNKDLVEEAATQEDDVEEDFEIISKDDILSDRRRL